MSRGSYIDPSAGKVRFRDYADEWLSRQTLDSSTREIVEVRLRLHAYPTLGSRELRHLKPGVLQAWLRKLQGELAPNHIRVVFANVSAVLKAAVDESLLAKNLCAASSVRPPAPDRRKVQPWPAETVEAVREALPARYQALVDAAAGCGLRQGEVFGLAVEDIDFLRGVVHVRRPS